MEPHSDVRAVCPLVMFPKADKATLASQAESLMARRVFCRSPSESRCTRLPKEQGKDMKNSAHEKHGHPCIFKFTIAQYDPVKSPMCIILVSMFRLHHHAIIILNEYLLIEFHTA